MELIKKITLILIGIGMVIGSNLMTPSLEIIRQSYDASAENLIPLMITLPALTSLIGMMGSAALTRNHSTKKLVMIGLLIFTIGGIVPAWLTSLPLILVFRALVGIGFGMVLPLQMELMNEYEEKTRARLIGLNVAVNCVMGILMIAVASVLADRNWHLIFYLYGIGILLLIMTQVCIPDPQKQTATATEPAKAAEKKPLPKQIWLYAANIAIVIGCAYTISVKVAGYVAEQQLGGVSEVSMLVSCATMAGVVAGLTMPKLDRMLKSMTACVVTLLVALGFYIYSMPFSLVMLLIGQVVVGYSQGMLGPWYALRATREVSADQVAGASAILNSTIFVFQFLSPYLYALVATVAGMLLGSEIASSMVFRCYAVILTVIGLGLIPYFRRR